MTRGDFIAGDVARVSSRAYTGATDLRLRQDLLVRHYGSTHTRIGDVAWRSRIHAHHELSLEINLWLDGDELIAWTWLRLAGA